MMQSLPFSIKHSKWGVSIFCLESNIALYVWVIWWYNILWCEPKEYGPSCCCVATRVVYLQFCHTILSYCGVEPSVEAYCFQHNWATLSYDLVVLRCRIVSGWLNTLHWFLLHILCPPTPLIIENVICNLG